MLRTIVQRLALTALICGAAAAPSDAATPCDALTSLGLGNGRVGSTHLVAAAAFVPSGAPPAGAVQALYARLPEFCRVPVTLSPSVDSDIQVEVWLPARGWNGKFQAVGNGGFAGVIPYPGMARALLEGYATAGTDTGHVGNNADFVPGHPEKLVDFAYRAVHEMTVAAKHVVDAHYGRGPQFSYFNGCSQGGRQAITSAQRYPADFDGIVAGAPAWDTMRSHAARLALNLTVNRSPDAVIPPAKYPVIHEAALKACDGLDGVTDGVIEDPTSCTVDFTVLACKEADGPGCLTPPQIASARAITAPLVHPGTGEMVFPGYLMPGAELGWGVLAGPRPLGLAQSGIANIVFGDKTWSDRSFNPAAHLDRIDASDRGLLKSNDPNLAPFFARGGKLLMYHGWADQQVPPQLSPLYYGNVLKAVGPSADQSIALFMMPGVYHCAGGPGPDNFDRMAVIEAWVEKGQKPTRILAWHQTAGKTDRTRPLCPIGQVAAHHGTGSTDDAANFACVAADAPRSSTARR
jgi:feruloyl esterase